jgi:hypothetical protein
VKRRPHPHSQLSNSFRSVNKSEQVKAIELWQTIFAPKSEGYLERYFSLTASPDYEGRDTLGA